MMLFISIASVLLLITIAILAMAYTFKPRYLGLDRKKQNIEIAKSRLQDLEQEKKIGNINQTDYLIAQKEIEGDLLLDIDSLHETKPQSKDEYWSFGLIAVFLITTSSILYAHYGKPDYLQFAGAGAGVKTQIANRQQEMDQLLIKLAKKMQENPNHAEGWFLLGRSYHTLGRYKEAADALEKAYQLNAKEPAILLTLADALIMLNQNKTAGRPAELITAALQLDPTNPNGLWLAALVAEEKQDYTQAISYFEKLIPLIQKETPQDVLVIQQNIQRLQKKGGMVSTAPPPIQKTIQAHIQLTLTLAPELAAKVQPSDQLFIYAVAMQGPKMPLVAIKTTASKLPLTITLDDTKAMIPNMTLSKFKQVKIGARISKKGGAIAQKGDLQGEKQNIKVKETTQLKIVIDKQL